MLFNQLKALDELTVYAWNKKYFVRDSDRVGELEQLRANNHKIN